MKNNITGSVPLAIICPELQGVITSKKESERGMKGLEVSVKLLSLDLYLSPFPLLPFSSTKGKCMFVSKRLGYFIVYVDW